jgi:hypothetical protein
MSPGMYLWDPLLLLFLPLFLPPTFFCFDPLFSTKKPPNATGPVLNVLIDMLSVHLCFPLLLSLLFL